MNFKDTLILKTMELSIANVVHEMDCSMLLIIVSEDEKSHASHICKDFPLEYLKRAQKEIEERIKIKTAELN